jgi:hypothetical protein
LKPVNRNNIAAQQLLTSINRSRLDHSVMAENLAHYNAQLKEPVTDTWDLMDLSVQRTPDENRWVRKISRELNRPYSDQQVNEQLGKLDQELIDLVRVKGSKFPSTLFVTGGINKGRFGGNSDLDVLGEGLLSDRSCEHLAAKPDWKVSKTLGQDGQTVAQSITSPSGVNAQFLPTPDFLKVSNWYGARFVVDVESAQKGETGIPEAVKSGFEAKGYEVRTEGGSLSLAGEGPEERELEQNREYPVKHEGLEVQKVAGRDPNLKERFSDWLGWKDS